MDMMNQPNTQPFFTDWITGQVTGAYPADGRVVTARRTYADLRGLWADEAARAVLPQDHEVYRTACVFPVAEGTPGGLLWGTTFIAPGLVGDEYHCTKGHFHALRDRAEIYFTFVGSGRIVYMDGDRRTWMEEMRPGSVHYIPGGIAHRTVNVGAGELAFGACWPSDAGHDYAAIARDGFAARVRRVDGRPVLVPA